MSGLRLWLMAARPRTLPAAIAPVLVGTAAAAWQTGGDGSAGGRSSPPWSGSIFIQIGTNLANDYSDAKRGADTADRLGPVRVTSAGLVAPRRVLYGTWLAFAVAVAAGIYLATVAGWVIIAVGAASIAAGVLYTGGPRPYGYAGMGELFVFLFFGARRRQRFVLRPARGARLAAVLALDLGRAALDRDPRREQHPRPRDRPPRRQADAGGPARARANASALRDIRRRRVRRPGHGHRRGRRAGRGLPRPSRGAARLPAAAGGAHPHGRARPQRRPGRHRRPARRLQPARQRRSADRV